MKVVVVEVVVIVLDLEVVVRRPVGRVGYELEPRPQQDWR